MQFSVMWESSTAWRSKRWKEACNRTTDYSLTRGWELKTLFNFIWSRFVFRVCVKETDGGDRDRDRDHALVRISAKCISALLAGSQSLRQLVGNCRVFAAQLPSELIRESWLTPPVPLCPCIQSEPEQNVNTRKITLVLFFTVFCILGMLNVVRQSALWRTFEWLPSVKLEYHKFVNSGD